MKCSECPDYAAFRIKYDLRIKRKRCDKAKRKKETADDMLAALGFRKNTSACYNEESGVLLYEKSVKDGTDIFEIYFNGGQVCYWDTAGHALWMDPELVDAIKAKMDELKRMEEDNG